MSGVFSLGLATQDGLAGQLSGVYLERLPEDYLETYRDRIRALTAEDVLAAARKYFDSANAQIVIVGDREQIGAQAALFGEVTEYDAQGAQVNGQDAARELTCPRRRNPNRAETSSDEPQTGARPGPTARESGCPSDCSSWVL